MKQHRLIPLERCLLMLCGRHDGVFRPALLPDEISLDVARLVMEELRQLDIVDVVETDVYRLTELGWLTVRRLTGASRAGPGDGEAK